MPPKAGALSHGYYENVQPEIVSQQVKPAIPGNSGNSSGPTQARKLPLLTLWIW